VFKEVVVEIILQTIPLNSDPRFLMPFALGIAKLKRGERAPAKRKRYPCGHAWDKLSNISDKHLLNDR
jgi:hypothetical protein